MIYKSKIGDIDLGRITRLYPAVVVDLNGEIAEMSLEWVELYGDKVKIKSFVLVFDFTPVHKEVKDRMTLEFETKDELMSVMQEVSQLFQN
ncbi:hypothetical protein CVO_03105 [Sulfurimonas sp. CVO]|uniref:Uncharacterized protein n=2 Tax=Sulfurimonadaceae TaxID=2771471 RepID=A0AAJ4A5G8_9BACT|nr:MAG: hypothetical protein C0628_09055 [Sulfurimonas sp.]QFR44235.1 hypothetical protein FJR47_06360 [Sulfurimonas xiamenensis]QHG92116.1 hypothetical protein CVO_03105 [Sulfurimonas sp. CVO]